jgi:hypothetical protein
VTQTKSVLALIGLSAAPTFTVPNPGKLDGAGGVVSLHGGAVGAARQLASGSVCWIGSWNACQHVGATAGVQTSRLQYMTHRNVYQKCSWNVLAVTCVGSHVWNVISVGWLLAVGCWLYCMDLLAILLCYHVETNERCYFLQCAQIQTHSFPYEIKAPAAVSIKVTALWAVMPLIVANKEA